MNIVHIASTGSSIENLKCGIKNSIWGNKKNLFKNFRKDDYLLIVSEGKFAALGKILDSPYISHTSVWRDDSYPYRVKVDFIYYYDEKDCIEYLNDSMIRDVFMREFAKSDRKSDARKIGFAIQNCKSLSEYHSKIILTAIHKKKNNIEMIKSLLNNKPSGFEETVNSQKSIQTDQILSDEKEKNVMTDTEINEAITTENRDKFVSEDEIKFDNKEEEFTPNNYIEKNLQVHTEQKDFTVLVLYQKYKEGKLILQPDFQRHFIWDRKKASRLIESALMRIPLPTFYLAQRNDNKLYVIDGQQRLRSFFSFIDGKFPEGSKFKLNGLQFYNSLNGKDFKTISDADQDKIKDCPLRSITFLPDSKEDIRFEIFERLNTGAVSLNDQELRNCIYRGPYNELLKELSKYPDFMFLLGLKKPDKRMNDISLVLRFSAFFNSGYLKYKSPMRTFFNNDMIENQNINEIKKEKIASAFKNSVSIIKSLFGEYAFRRFYIGDENDKNGIWKGTVNKSLYDVLMNSFADKDKNIIYSKLDCIREAFIDLMTSDKNFVESIELATSDVKKVHTRFDLWRIRLNQILENTNKQQRCFSFELKKYIYEHNPICQICGQHISCLDDATLDHVEQYWKGGQTIPENARLTHRYCNLSRSRFA